MLKTNIFLVIFILLFFTITWFFSNIFNVLDESYRNPFICGDNSLNGTCSDTKPFFCDNGILVSKAEVCGCGENLTISGNSCVSKFQTEGENVTLKYILRGQEYKFNYTVYKSMRDYLSELPVYINYNGEEPKRVDFKLRNINEKEQKVLLLPLVVEIQNRGKDKEEQMRIAISIVQNIEWNPSNKTTVFRNNVLNYSRYPYEVLYDMQGICGEKSELLAFLLKEIGYGVAIFYNQEENHESVGIKCPLDKSWKNSGYCFVETTGPSIITDTKINYVGGIQLKSEPEVMIISDGESLNEKIYEYEDAEKLIEARNAINGEDFFFNPKKIINFKKLEKKYGLVKEYQAG